MSIPTDLSTCDNIPAHLINPPAEHFHIPAESAVPTPPIPEPTPIATPEPTPEPTPTPTPKPSFKVKDFDEILKSCDHEFLTPTWKEMSPDFESCSDFYNLIIRYAPILNQCVDRALFQHSASGLAISSLNDFLTKAKALPIILNDTSIQEDKEDSFLRRIYIEFSLFTQWIENLKKSSPRLYFHLANEYSVEDRLLLQAYLFRLEYITKYPQSSRFILPLLYALNRRTTPPDLMNPLDNDPLLRKLSVYGDIRSVILLYLYNINFNLANNHGNTALHLLFIRIKSATTAPGHYIREAIGLRIKMLLYFGSEITPKNDQERTAYEIAREVLFPEEEDLLILLKE